MPIPRGTSRIPELDGIRGVAILLVLIWHYAVVQLLAFPHDTLIAKVRDRFGLTWSGVDLFFVLSGFLIGGILIDARESPAYFRTFYIRRFFRIVPIYAVICLIFLLVAVLFGSAQQALGPPMPWYVYATFSQNLFLTYHKAFSKYYLEVAWSLAVEEQFYLTIPLLIWLIPRKHLLKVMAAIVALTPIVRTLFFYKSAAPAVSTYTLVICRADGLALGVIGAILMRRPEIRQLLSDRKWILNTFMASFFLGVAALTRKKWFIGSPAMSTWGYTCLALFYLSVVLMAVTRTQGWLGRAMRNRYLMALGTIAYATYLLHVQVCFGLHHLLRGHDPELRSVADVLVNLLALACTLAAAQLSWRFFESRLVSYGHKFSYRGVTGDQALASSALEAPAADAQRAGEG